MRLLTLFSLNVIRVVLSGLATGLVLCVATWPAVAQAAVLQGTVEQIASDDWQIKQLEFGVELTDDGLRGAVRIARLLLPAADLELTDTRIVCTRIVLSGPLIDCDAAQFNVDFPGSGRQTVAGSFTYHRDTGEVRFQILELPLAGGTVTLAGTVTDDDLGVEFESTELQLEGLQIVAAEFGLDSEELAAAGSVRLQGRFSSGQDQSLIATAALRNVALSNASGTIVTDALDGQLKLNAAIANGRSNFDVDIAATQGEAYIEPVYANLAEHPVRIRLQNASTVDNTEFEFPEFRIEQGALLAIFGNVQVVLATAEAPMSISGRIALEDSDVAALYSSGLQIAAAGTLFGELETAGRISGEVELRNNVPMSAAIQLDDIAIDDTRRRFAIYGLSGNLNWPGPDGGLADVDPSRLRWDSASAYNIILEGGELHARIGGDDVELLAPLRLPTMGGAVLINRLLMNDYGTENASGLLDAELLPIQLGQLSGAFGWPAFSGSLSGKLPLLQYEGNAMTVGGTLAAQAFDGEIAVSNLRLEQPFGRVPRLQADLRLRNLDLKQLTDTFSFGLIQGRLSGDVTGLEMAAWKPVAMDLHLYTPPDDKSRHRISQRAVENLTSVGGGGAGAVLSTGFLKFFEVFAYDKVAIRCVLHAGSCTMSGAGRAGDGPLGSGYYIVKGSGLPRIDVVGYRREVNWERLLNQLGQISGAAVVN